MVTYRTSDPARWGTGKGANLTAGEIDGNFWELAERIAGVEGTAPQPNNIANVTVTGSQMTIHMQDGTVHGPFTLPVAMIHYRGDWVAGAAYSELDLVAEPTLGIFLVLRDHTAAAAFDAAATDASGNPLYRYLFPISGGAGALSELSDVSVGTPADGMVLTCYGGTWYADTVPAQHINDLDGIYNPEGATTGQVLAFNVTGTGWWEPVDLPAGGGAATFLDLTDTPTAFGAPGTMPAVNAAGTALEFVSPATGGGIADAPADGATYGRLNAAWTPIDATVNWADIPDKPAAFPPAAHTHTTADITDFAEALQEGVGGMLVAGANVTLTYDDAAGTLTIASAAGTGSGATTFIALTDTPAAFGSAGQLAAVNGTGDGLVFVDPPSGTGGAGALNDLSDVTLAGPVAAQFLRYTGTAWVNAALAWADIPDRPATFPPSAHTHAWGDVTGRPATVDGLPAGLGAAGQVMKMNATEDGIEWAAEAGGLGDAPVDGNLYGRKDGAWSVVNLPPAEGAFKYWRLRLISEDQMSAGTAIYLGEIQFRETAGVDQPASGGTAFGNFGTVAALFDGSKGGGTSTPAPYTDKVAGYQFVTARAVQQIALHSSNNLADYGPERFVIEASNDGVTYIEVTRSDPLGWPSQFGTVEVIIAAPAVAEPVEWADVINKPATVDALPATIGAAGQIMKVQADGTIAWAADATDGTGGGSAGYRGARAQVEFTPGAINTFLKVPLAASGVDTGDVGFDDDNDRFVIPAGISLVRFRVGMVQNTTTDQRNQWKIAKNGTRLDPGQGSFSYVCDPVGFNNSGREGVTGPLAVAAGDILELNAYSAAAVTFIGWLEMEVLA